MAVRTLGAGSYGLRHRLAARLRHGWVRLAVERWERQAYLGARCLLVNYESVRRLIVDKYGARPAIEKIPYTCEAAFARPAGACSAGGRRRRARRRRGVANGLRRCPALRTRLVRR